MIYLNKLSIEYLPTFLYNIIGDLLLKYKSFNLN